MSGPSDLWIGAVVACGLLLALVRLALWRRAAPVVERGPAWRLPVLVALNGLAAALLYLALAPPDVGVRSGRLVVLTAGAPPDVAVERGDIIVALPEAQDHTGARAPDLATALRRHPEVRRIQVLGQGLIARDREAMDRSVGFDPPSAPIGLVRLSLPEPVAAGAPFAVSGAVGRLPAGSVAKLADPSGAVVDQAPVAAGGAFTLRGTARAAGLAVFELRLESAASSVIERIDVPVQARAPNPPRVIVMAGAPGPEPRFLRRWAEAAGIDLTIRLSLGAGVDLTARAVPLTAQALAETDLLVIDERRWDTLSGGERAAVQAATAGGLGLLLRPTGPLSDATRRDWAALGAPLTGGETLRPLTLDEPRSSEGRTSSPADDDAAAIELMRRDFAQGGSAAVLLADTDGTPLATWRPYGSGRVGVWTVADSYALVLSGQPDRYGALWSALFSALARPEGETPPRVQDIARAGDRAALCGVEEGDALIAPDGERRRLIPDPRAGPSSCAAFWPRTSGWHAVVSADEERGVVYVHPADATPSLIAAEMRQAMQDLQAGEPRPTTLPSRSRSGSPWPWFLAFLACAAGLWWLERRRSPTSPSPS